MMPTQKSKQFQLTCVLHNSMYIELFCVACKHTTKACLANRLNVRYMTYYRLQSFVSYGISFQQPKLLTISKHATAIGRSKDGANKNARWSRSV